MAARFVLSRIAAEPAVAYFGSGSLKSKGMPNAGN
jgi:hypothetical protein